MNLLFCDNSFVFQVNAEMIALVSLGNVLYLMILIIGDGLLSIYIVYMLVHVFNLFNIFIVIMNWHYNLPRNLHIKVLRGVGVRGKAQWTVSITKAVIEICYYKVLNGIGELAVYKKERKHIKNFF